MYPVILQYHPGLVEVWPRVFIEYGKIKKSYGDYAFDNEVAPVINLWQSVREFWRGVQKQPKCTVALHTLVMNLMAEWEQKRKDDSSPTLHGSIEMAARRDKDIREKAEELDAYGYSYSHQYQNPRTSGASEHGGGDSKMIKPNPNPNPGKKGESKVVTDNPKIKPNAPGVDATFQDQCRKCGGNHATTACISANPDLNDDLSVTFAESAKGKAWIAMGRQTAPFGAHLSLDFCAKNPRPPKKGPGKPAGGGGGPGTPPPYPQKHRKNKSKSTDVTGRFLSALDDIDREHASIIPLVVSVSPFNRIEFRCLIDTGSLQSNFASGNVKRQLGATKMDRKDNGCKVCSPISEVCVACSDQTTLQCSIFNDVTISNFNFERKFKFLDSWHIKKYDMIIGLVDI
jgi:hypothetical protein